MQTVENRNIHKRTRYYQGMIDLNILEKGENYKSLKKSFVIFICTFDLFGRGRHRSAMPAGSDSLCTGIGGFRTAE